MKYDDGYNDEPEYIEGVEVMDRWFSSDTWNQVTQEAEQGDTDSLDLMEAVNDHLTSLIFHMKNNSGPARVMYELRFFNALCDDFGVA